MAIVITSGSISFDGQEFKKGDVTASKEFETKRKSDSGIPLKRLRAFNSASTFIDMNTSRRGQRPGQAIDIFVKDTYEAFHVSPNKVSIGPKPNIALELTGSISTDSTNITLEASSNVTISGSTFASGSSGSFDYSNVSWMQLENMSMDINQGGFFGLAVSGSTAASNIHNMANNLSGFFLTGSNVIISGSTELSGSTIITGGDTQITGSTIISGSTIITGGDTEITGSTVISGSTIITGGDTQITGSTIFSSDSGSLPSGFVSGSEPTGSSEIVVEGDIEVSGSIIENYTNNVPISASILLTTALHGQGRQLFVRSGSAAIDATTGGGGLPAGLPVGNGIYKSTQPAGNMIITLPSASVGMSFHIINHNSPSNMAPFIGNQYGPSLYIDPSGSQRFAFGANGGAAVAGKAIINHSGSNQTGDFIKVYCISSTAPQWMIFQTGGTWTDEA